MKSFIFTLLIVSLSAAAGAQDMKLLDATLPDDSKAETEIKTVSAKGASAEELPGIPAKPEPEAAKTATAKAPATSGKMSASEYASRYLHPSDRKVLPKEDKVVSVYAAKYLLVRPWSKKVSQKEKSPVGGFTVLKRHRIVKGDTLWDLSQKYYGDPFMWGRIYNANFSSVENPDLIYPKDELVIPDITEVLIPYRTPVVAETEVSPEEWAAEEDPYDDYVSAEAVPAAMAPTPAELSEALKPLARNVLSEEMPKDQKEWSDGGKIAPGSWRYDGTVIAKVEEEDEFLAEALSITGGVVKIKMERSGMVRPGDYLDIYLRGVEIFDDSGNLLGREIQPVGMAEVSSVDGAVVKARIINASTGIRKGYIVKKK